VNIVKDAGRDAERGTSFIPQQVLTRHGADPDSLLGADQREAGLRAVEEICDLASAYLAAANRYTLSWPEDGVGRDIRLFCTVPLLLAHATLRTVRVHPNTLAPGGTPKVGREDVMRALDEAVRAASDTSALDALLVRWAA
jgi:farnesyl-diphosphate farnesyltransferase